MTLGSVLDSKFKTLKLGTSDGPSRTGTGSYNSTRARLSTKGGLAAFLLNF